MSIPHLSTNARPLAAEQKQQAAELLARAFQPDPLMKFLLPEDARRAQVLPWYFGKALNYALRHGEVYADPQMQGVTAWLPPGHHITTWGYIRAGFLPIELKLGRAGYHRLQANESYVDALHAAQMPQPHWYLWFVGVEPQAKGRGIGSALIRQKLAQADDEGLPCYLETHNPANVAFYEKLGFRVLQAGQIPGSELKMWAMGRG